jgi:hypothetical protein
MQGRELKLDRRRIMSKASPKKKKFQKNFFLLPVQLLIVAICTFIVKNIRVSDNNKFLNIIFNFCADKKANPAIA